RAGGLLGAGSPVSGGMQLTTTAFLGPPPSAPGSSTRGIAGSSAEVPPTGRGATVARRGRAFGVWQGVCRRVIVGSSARVAKGRVREGSLVPEAGDPASG